MAATDPSPFAQRALVAAIVGAAVVAAALVAIAAHEVILLAFAGVLLAIFLRSLAAGVARLTRLPVGVALLLVVVLLIGAVVGLGAWMAPELVDQVQQLTQRIPQSVQKLRGQLEQLTWGRWVLANLPEPTGALGKVAAWLSTTLAHALDLVVVVFVGLYLAAQPATYLGGALRLVPVRRRGRATMVLNEAAYELRWWLIGQVFAMLLIAVMVATGLWIVGVPLALLLGLIAGALNFIPTFGPIVAAVPAVLIALTDQPIKALWVILVYVVAQHVETYGITPMIQQRNVDLPAALTIVAQVLMALLVGPLGIAIAAPLMVLTIVLVKMLYVEDVLGDRLALPGENERKIKDTELT